MLQELTGQDLTDVMPGRVLPVSASPPSEVGLVVGKEVEQISAMLRPGKRQTAEARARLIPLLALDRAARGETEPPAESEIQRIVGAVKDQREWSSVFPGVVGLQLVGGLRSSDHVQEVSLRIDPKRGELAVRPADEDEEAVAYREVDTFDKYSLKLTKLGGKLGLSRHQGLAVVEALGLKDDPKCYREKRSASGSIQFQGLSNAALERAKRALQQGLDVEGAVDDYNARRRTGVGTSR
ncbi:hypothetical protein [Nesterenkonia populi]|uniref:hypothetical protein n=1 Tax=Nesterenkonia populi TaxID=1591087 RepID=UPI001B866CB9|nr:hypothetical protein [Nesterenkonia populi]